MITPGRTLRKYGPAAVLAVSLGGALGALALSFGTGPARKVEVGTQAAVVRPPAKPSTPLPPEKRAPRATAAKPPSAPVPPLRAHPHPITPEHQRLYREVDMLDRVKRLLAARDFAPARQLLAEHRRQYPRLDDDVNEGYEIVADCLEHPGPEASDRAQRFYETKTFSTVRRRVRRACL